MTEHELERRLRGWYRAEIRDDETAPAELRAQVATIPRTRHAPGRRPWSRRDLTLLIAAALTTALIGGAIAIGSGVVRLTSVVSPPPSPDLSPTPLPSASLATPGASGSWAITGKMKFDSWNAVAALLPNGKVLVVGGGGSRDLVTAASAELYDPLTGRWTETGSLQTPRGLGHTATSLPDGKVLVAGGDLACEDACSHPPQRSAELYDPAAGTWTETGSMAVARSYHSATLLPDGKVLVAGGASGDASKTAELYDPATGSWMSTGSMTVARGAPSAALLPDGEVLVVGGAASSGRDLQSAELYDPRRGTWASARSFQGAGGCRVASALLGGKVLVVCAEDNGARTSGALFDPASGTWAKLAPPPAQCCRGESGPHGSIVRLLDGRVLWKDLLDAGELFDPASGTWASAGGPTYPADPGWRLPYTGTDEGRGYEADTLTLLPDGRVLMTTLGAGLLYDPNRGR